MNNMMSRIISRQISKIKEEDKEAKQSIESLRAFRRQRVASRQLPSQPTKKPA